MPSGPEPGCEGCLYRCRQSPGDDPMLSIVSVISVNLIASVATRPAEYTDSTRAAAPKAAAAFTHRAAAVEAQLLTTARRYLGTRYRLGGTKPSAFDCSGFVRFVFARHGVELPRTARAQ